MITATSRLPTGGLSFFAVVAALALSLPSPARADVDLVFSPSRNFATLGCDEIINIDLVARANAGANELISGLDVILVWDSAALEFLGEFNCIPPGGGGCPWLGDGFFTDADGINDNLDDGDAIYSAFAQLGAPATVTPAGLVVTTLRFRARAVSAGADLSIAATMGMFAMTVVLDDASADVTGDISSVSTSVIVQPCSCAVGDVNEDGEFTTADFGAAVDVLLGLDTDPDHIAAVDANCDTFANGDDIQLLIDFLYTALDL